MSRSFILLAILAGLLAAPRTARPRPAQTAAPPPGATPRRRAPPAAADADAPLPPGEIRVKAESQEQLEKGHYAWRGLVDLRAGEARILADKADVYEEKRPDGSVGQRFVAEGNVVFIRGEERLSGDRMEMDDAGRGFFENAVGFVSPGVFVEGRRVERVDKDTYRVEGGKFTACAQPNPRWMFQSSSARIEVDDKIVAKNAVFRIKGVPAFYLPILYYPINSSGRSSGFLFPHFGYSSTKGFEIGTGFFWAMGRSLDQTFYGDYYSNLGFGVGHELRYASASPSRGTFRTYLFRLRAESPVYDPDTGELVGGRAVEGRLRHRLERAPDDPGQRAGDPRRPQVLGPPLLAALQRQLQHGVVADGALLGRGREGPQARRPLRLLRPDGDLLRHRLHAHPRAAARPQPAPLPAARRLGQGRLRPRRRLSTACSTAPGTHSTRGRGGTSRPPSRARSR